MWQAGRQAGKQAGKQIGRQADRQASRFEGRQEGRQAGRQKNKRRRERVCFLPITRPQFRSKFNFPPERATFADFPRFLAIRSENGRKPSDVSPKNIRLAYDVIERVAEVGKRHVT